MPKKPIIAVLVGSKSDESFMTPAYEQLNAFSVHWEKKVLSAHRQPDKLRTYVLAAEKKGVKIFIAAAGLSAALPGAVASLTLRPVIGIPVPSGPLKGIDALLSIAQMPGGIPAAVVGLGSQGPKNAALIALEILAIEDQKLAVKLKNYRDKLKNA
jgi:5-(carboxyamino)imidazole ribonucleotide mutase